MPRYGSYPSDHHPRHEKGGVDEVSVVGLSGELADYQKAETDEFTSDPTADATHLGRIIRVRAGAGNKTYVKICVQNNADGYEWIQIGVST